MILMRVDENSHENRLSSVLILIWAELKIKSFQRSEELLIFIRIGLVLPLSSTASRRKLHNSIGPCIPALYHCDHRCVASDYIPTLRLLCHSERLREAANIKRRYVNML